MLSIPGIKGLMKTKDTRKNREREFAEFFASQSQGTSDIPSYLLYLAKRLDISLLALIDVDASGQAAGIQAAGSGGLASELTVPRLEGEGPIAGLINRARPAAGKARVFSKEEVFPKDGAWCDLIPMDSVAAYVFIPISSMPLAETAEEIKKHCHGRFLLAAEDPGTDRESALPLKIMLAAGLIGFSLTVKGRQKDRETLRILRDLLKEEGYSIGFADDSGRLIEKDGNGFDGIKADVMERLRQQLASFDTEASGSTVKPKDLTTPEMENLKIAAYPVMMPGSDPGCMVVVKECDFASQVRNRRERLKLLSRFISSIAHEIKNPLTGIAAGVQYLAKKIQPGIKEDETVEFILTEINRLNRIVDDLYKAAKPPQLTLMQVDLNDIVGRSLICLSEDITKKRLAVSQDLAKAVPELEADPDRLQQVFINIFKNAIEASPEGGTLRIETFLEDSKAGVRVTDQGAGIGLEEREKIFEPFYSTKDRGSGLGLCISQRIVDEHGGSIRVEAPEGGGTSFVIELPTGR